MIGLTKFHQYNVQYFFQKTLVMDLHNKHFRKVINLSTNNACTDEELWKISELFFANLPQTGTQQSYSFLLLMRSVNENQCFEMFCLCLWMLWKLLFYSSPCHRIYYIFCQQYICLEMEGEKWPEFKYFRTLRKMSKFVNYSVKQNGLSVSTSQFSQPLKNHKIILWKQLF